MLTYPPSLVARQRRATRRGLSTPMLLMVVMSALLFIVMAIDLAQLSLQRQEMQVGSDAAVLAAVPHLMDQRWLALGTESIPVEFDDLSDLPGRQATHAFTQAQLFAGSNKVAGQPIELTQDAVIIGYLADPTSGNPTMAPIDETYVFNSFGIELTRSKLGDNPPVLWLAKQTGLDNIDIVVRSQACVDTRIHGFQPLAHVNVPIVPLGLFEHRGEGQADVHSAGYSPPGDDMPAQVWWARGPADYFRCDPIEKTVTEGCDGTSEMVFRLQLDTGQADANTPRARPSAIFTFLDQSLSNEEMVKEMVLQFGNMAIHGATAQDLVSLDGRVTLSDDLPALVPALFSLSRDDLAMLRSLFQNELLGQPRIWPVVADCSSVTPAGEQTLGILGFVAGCVVDCKSDTDGSLLVTIQPCLLQTPTALTEAAAQQNPWIGKLLLVR